MIDEKSPNSVGILKRKTKRELSRREVLDFFAHLVVVDPRSWPRFRFIGMFAVGLGISWAVGLAIRGAILTGADIDVGFSGLSL